MEENENNVTVGSRNAESMGSTRDFQETAQSSNISRGEKKGNPILFVLIIIIVLAILGGGAFYLLKDPVVEDEKTTTESTLTVPQTDTKQEPTSVPTSTPEPVNKDEVTIRVLNGTGIAGEAGYLKGKLEDLGYSDINAANADDQDNIATIITFSDDLSSDVVSEITKELEGIYQSVQIKTSGSIDTDIEIITGLRTGQNKPTETPKVEEEVETTPSPSETITASPTP